MDPSQTIMENADLEELADIISKRVNNPITIEDANHRLIAYSTHGNWSDKARMETIMGRRVPESVLNRLWQDGVLQRLMESDQPIRIEAKNEVGLGMRVAISIRKGHAVLGYIYVQEINQPLGEPEMFFLKKAALSAMPKLHRRQAKKRIQDEKSKEFFWELLYGHLHSHQEISARAEFIHIKLPRPFSVFIFAAEESQHEIIHKELVFLLTNLKESLSLQSFPMWVTNQQHFILLGGTKSSLSIVEFERCCSSFVQEVTGRLQQRFGPHAVTGVYGQAYELFPQIQRSYQQGLHVLRMKKLLPHEMAAISGYIDLGIYRMLPAFIEKNAEEGYINPKLQRLIQYDQENQSNLLATLETYLDCAGHMNTVAKQLHIHPNTLTYRLRRIGEVSGIDLDDPNQRVTMFIDLKIRKISE